jgi:hypothetical protein
MNNPFTYVFCFLAGIRAPRRDSLMSTEMKAFFSFFLISTNAVLKANAKVDWTAATRCSYMFHITAYSAKIMRLSKFLSTYILASADYSDHAV